MARSYRPMVLCMNEPKFAGNALRFKTEGEALASADALMSRWMLVIDTRADATDDEPTYSHVDGRDVALEKVS